MDSTSRKKKKVTFAPETTSSWSSFWSSVVSILKMLTGSDDTATAANGTSNQLNWQSEKSTVGTSKSLLQNGIHSNQKLVIERETTPAVNGTSAANPTVDTLLIDLSNGTNEERLNELFSDLKCTHETFQQDDNNHQDLLATSGQSSKEEGECSANETVSDFDWCARASSASNASDPDDPELREERKQLKKLRYRENPPIDLENYEALQEYIAKADDPYGASIALIEGTYAQKLDNERIGVIVEAVAPVLRQRIPDFNEVDLGLKMAALESYITNRVIEFEFFDELLSVSTIQDKPLLGEYLLERLKEAANLHGAEKVLNLFTACKVTNQHHLLTALLILFFKVRPSTRLLCLFSNLFLCLLSPV